ncbi:hypothetical protein HY501_00965 [Candidatus Woesearchaeota archaeon]|nr:hypothetical protein [Candidatus Woesearchaeota archaeon]
MSEKIVLYSAIIIAVFVLAFSVVTMLQTGQTKYTESDYQQAMSAELPDKCATPPGYTDASWREHMGHHPDQYAECLG